VSTAGKRAQRRAAVAELLADGHSVRAIARQLGVDHATIRRDRRALNAARQPGPGSPVPNHAAAAVARRPSGRTSDHQRTGGGPVRLVPRRWRERAPEPTPPPPPPANRKPGDPARRCQSATISGARSRPRRSRRSSAGTGGPRTGRSPLGSWTSTTDDRLAAPLVVPWARLREEGPRPHTRPPDGASATLAGSASPAPRRSSRWSAPRTTPARRSIAAASSPPRPRPQGPGAQKRGLQPDAVGVLPSRRAGFALWVAVLNDPKDNERGRLSGTRGPAPPGLTVYLRYTFGLLLPYRSAAGRSRARGAGRAFHARAGGWGSPRRPPCPGASPWRADTEFTCRGSRSARGWRRCRRA
jgi:hypothetical protein